MDLYDLQNNVKTLFGEQATIEFDKRCIRQVEVVHDGPSDEWHALTHVVYDHACVVTGDERKYIRISPHRAFGKAVELGEVLHNVPSFKLEDDKVLGLRREIYEGKSIDEEVSRLSELTKLPAESISQRVDEVPEDAVITVDELLPELVRLKKEDVAAYEVRLNEWMQYNQAPREKIEELVSRFDS